MNELSRSEFVARYGGLYEHSPWVAEAAYEKAAGLDAASLAALFAAQVDRADDERKLALIRAHPDLAGRAAVAGELTESSTEEQMSARLDRCTAAEYDEFQRLNDAYRERFGFPFVMAVRGRSRQEILAAFRRRIGNEPAVEFANAIGEIHKIAKLRLEAL